MQRRTRKIRKRKYTFYNNPESRYILNKKGNWEVWYNEQIAVDRKNKIIVANKVVQQVNDKNQFIPIVNKIKKAITTITDEKKIKKDIKDTNILADDGYMIYKTLKQINRDLNAYIPDKTQTTHDKNKIK